DLLDNEGYDLLTLKAAAGSNTVEMSLRHEAGYRDPILYGHIADNLNNHLHVLLYIMNDPDSERYDVDQLPDGSATKFGTLKRNLEAEEAAMKAGLSPGQIRKGLRVASKGQAAFELFVKSLGHDMYFVEPLYYHNAVIFESYGFKYRAGRRRMESIQAGFQPGGEFTDLLDGSTFRVPEAVNSIRLRSWAIHDGILGAPFTNVSMYKSIGKHAGLNTAEGSGW
ncbi:MAG: hypothetical protein IH859_07635, partial [Chloroflexi bacterium]|nr:hypothetical protein [Chloroflexota bacterium]